MNGQPRNGGLLSLIAAVLSHEQRTPDPFGAGSPFFVIVSNRELRWRAARARSSRVSTSRI